MNKSNTEAEKLEKARQKKKEMNEQIKDAAKQAVMDGKKRRAGITFKLIVLALVPALVTIAGLLTTSVLSLKSGLEKEAMDGLELLAGAVQSIYQDLDGEYRVSGSKLYKGDEELTINPGTLDKYVEDSEAELTICYGKTRMITTLVDEKSVRITGTDISDEVWETVSKGGKYRTTDITISGKKYCAVYIPLMENNEVIGCVFAGQPSAEITSFVLMRVVYMLLVGAVILVVVIVAAYIMARTISVAIKKASASVNRVASGDLTTVVDASVLNRKDEIGDVGRDLMTLIEKLREIVGHLLESAGQLGESGNNIDAMASQSSVAAGEISTAVEEISKGAVSQAEEIETATSEVISMGEQITKIVNNITDLTRTSRNMEDAEIASENTMEELSDAVQRTTEAVERISQQIELTNESVDKIGNAASLIADIASQTSLLSLNASIESARAGEAGKGFAVVASEIQKLSAQSDSTANKIQEIITTLQEESKQSLEVMQRTEVLVKEQYEKLTATKDRFKEVSNGIGVSREGTNVIKGNAEVCDKSRVTVVDVISNLSAISEENAASTQQTTSSMQELNATINLLAEMAAKIKDVSDKLNEDMKYFKM